MLLKIDKYKDESKHWSFKLHLRERDDFKPISRVLYSNYNKGQEFAVSSLRIYVILALFQSAEFLL